MVDTRDVAILTGASSGIGFAVAELLARSGCAIVLSSRTPQAAVSALGRVHSTPIVPVPGDISDVATTNNILEAAASMGGVTKLLLNHGGPPVKSFLSVSDDDWADSFRMMVQGPLRLLRGVIPQMQARNGGRVVAISSFTVKSPYPGIVLSNALRAALVNALKTAAQELGDKNILINAVAPGYIATDRLTNWNKAHAERSSLTLPEVVSANTASIPLGRYGEPSDVADAIDYLLSQRNKYITGQQILIDGGLVTAT